MHNQTRKFGVMYADPVTDTDLFNKTAAKYGVKFAPGAAISYPATDDPFGNPTVAQEQAPVAHREVQVGRRHHDPAPRRTRR